MNSWPAMAVCWSTVSIFQYGSPTMTLFRKVWAIPDLARKYLLLGSAFKACRTPILSANTSSSSDSNGLALRKRPMIPELRSISRSSASQKPLVIGHRGLGAGSLIAPDLWQRYLVSATDG